MRILKIQAQQKLIVEIGRLSISRVGLPSMKDINSKNGKDSE